MFKYVRAPLIYYELLAYYHKLHLVVGIAAVNETQFSCQCQCPIIMILFREKHFNFVLNFDVILVRTENVKEMEMKWGKNQQLLM